jgi:hypothetical protein
MKSSGESALAVIGTHRRHVHIMLMSVVDHLPDSRFAHEEGVASCGLGVIGVISHHVLEFL